MYLKIDNLVHCASIFAEEFFTPYFTNIPQDGIWQIFTANEHCWLIFSMVDVISARYLPAFFNIHPQVFAENILSIFVFFIVLFFCAIFSENLTKFSKNKFLLSLGTLCIFPLVIYCLKTSDFFWTFYNTIWVYSYFLLPMFPLLLMKEFELFYIDGQKITNRKNIIIFFLIIFTAVSHDFFRIVFIIALFIGYFFHSYLLGKINSKNFWAKYSIFTILNLLLFLTPQFIDVTKDRCNISYFKNLDYIIDLSSKFLTGIKDYLLLANFWLFIVILITWTIIFIFVNDSQKKIKFYIYSCSLIIGAFAFWLMMFVVNDYNDLLILSHQGLRFLFSSLLLF